MSQKHNEDEDNDPEVIKARADARATILAARAKLSPAAQTVYALWDGLNDFIRQIGCLLVILIIVIAFFAPQLFQMLGLR